MDAPAYKSSVAWQKAMQLADAVYLATRSFPKEELFALTNQMRRAAVSIPSNLAEGQGRLTPREFLHFLGVARGSARELETQLEIAMRQGYGKKEEIVTAMGLAEEVNRILNASIATHRARMQSPKPV